MSALTQHLSRGVTTVCRCWRVTRADGQTYGFTDHDLPVVFDGQRFEASTGMTARAIEQGTGLAVDNSEAVGALSSAAITEADIDQGRLDGAEVVAWLVNWRDVSERVIQFRGTIGELRRSGGAFHAELRGLSDALNQPQGRIFHPDCAAVLGDSTCGIDLTDPAFVVEAGLLTASDGRSVVVPGAETYPSGWFERGVLRVISGDGAALQGVVKHDRLVDGAREVTLWEPLRVELQVGDIVRLTAGCDKRGETCRVKFGNFVNFRGFPHIPGEDWLVSVPRGVGDDGGSLNS